MVRDSEEAELALATEEYSLLLLDLGLPGKGGLDLLAELRGKANLVPVIILTARDAVSDRLVFSLNFSSDLAGRPPSWRQVHKGRP